MSVLGSIGKALSKLDKQATNLLDAKGGNMARLLPMTGKDFEQSFKGRWGVDQLRQGAGDIGAVFGRRRAAQNIAKAFTKTGAEYYKAYKDYTNPDVPEAGLQEADTSMLRMLAEDAARRRRGLAGRSLLRSSLRPGSSLGTTTAGSTAKLGK